MDIVTTIGELDFSACRPLTSLLQRTRQQTQATNLKNPLLSRTLARYACPKIRIMSLISLLLSQLPVDPEVDESGNQVPVRAEL